MSGISFSLQEIKAEDRSRVGGKGSSLAVMTRGGLRVPPALCITPEAYREFVTATGIRETILLELGWKSFEDIRHARGQSRPAPSFRRNWLAAASIPTLFPFPHFLLPHRHGVDQRKDFRCPERAFPAQLHLPILAD